MPFTVDLVVDFIVDVACMGLRSYPSSEVTWQMLCKAYMVKPCLCQALHIIVDPITAAPQASSMWENIPKNCNSYKKSNQWKYPEMVLLVYIALILCKQMIIHLSSTHQFWCLKWTWVLSSIQTFHWLSPASFWPDPTNLFPTSSHVCSLPFDSFFTKLSATWTYMV